ncbi:MAG: hypothetical protein HY203_00730 [Nitrospirae bacterium]|nr:hypothetical protein [Nitrospirota bacterium]
MGKGIKQTGEKLVKAATKNLGDLVYKAKDMARSSGINAKIQTSSKQVKEILDESGISEKISNISATASDQLDTISGAKILQLVEQRLELQARYNDILATKLEEALNKIRELEIQVEKLTETRSGT